MATTSLYILHTITIYSHLYVFYCYFFVQSNSSTFCKLFHMRIYRQPCTIFTTTSPTQYLYTTSWLSVLISCNLLKMKNESCYFEWLQLQRNVTGVPHGGIKGLLQQVAPVYIMELKSLKISKLTLVEALPGYVTNINGQYTGETT